MSTVDAPKMLPLLEKPKQRVTFHEDAPAGKTIEYPLLEVGKHDI